MEQKAATTMSDDAKQILIETIYSACPHSILKTISWRTAAMKKFHDFFHIGNLLKVELSRFILHYATHKE